LTTNLQPNSNPSNHLSSNLPDASITHPQVYLAITPFITNHHPSNRLSMTFRHSKLSPPLHLATKINPTQAPQTQKLFTKENKMNRYKSTYQAISEMCNGPERFYS
jgi:hypothetical protein